METITCNGGTVAARGISAERGCLTSQLNITFNVDLQGRTVRCSVDNGTHASVVGRDVLALSTGLKTCPNYSWSCSPFQFTLKHLN